MYVALGFHLLSLSGSTVMDLGPAVVPLWGSWEQNTLCLSSDPVLPRFLCSPSDHGSLLVAADPTALPARSDFASSSALTSQRSQTWGCPLPPPSTLSHLFCLFAPAHQPGGGRCFADTLSSRFTFQFLLLLAELTPETSANL